jgi:AraC-like DNA-binding protein
MFGKATLHEVARIGGRSRACTPALLPGATVTGDDVARLAGAGHRFLATDIAPEQPVLTGHLTAQALRPGLRVHCAEVNDLHDMRTHTAAEPGLRVLILLDGCVDVSFGSRRVSVSARPERGGAARPVGLLIGLAQAEIFERRWQRGAYERKVVVTVESGWLASCSCGVSAEGEGSTAVRDFLSRHLAIERWQPSPRAIAIAEQLVRAPAMQPLQRHLFLESRAIELVSEAVASLDRADPARIALRPDEYRRARELRDFLDGDACDGLSLDEMARRIGVNANTLQRQFRAAFGATIFEYLRESRLQRARAALERRGLNVAEAARLAGYTSPANFATAYKRRFGVSPKMARARI